MRRKIAIIGAGVVVALIALYLGHIFYIQSLLVVWGVAIMLGTYVYDRRAGKDQAGTSASQKGPSLVADLAEAQGGRGGRVDGAVRRDPRSTEAVGGGAPLSARAGPRAQSIQDQKERSHLHEALEEAIEVLSTDAPDAARTRVALIASDLKAHYRAIHESGEGSVNSGDYAAAWTVLHAVSGGVGVDQGIFRHAPKDTKSQLRAILDLAVSRGAIKVSA